MFLSLQFINRWKNSAFYVFLDYKDFIFIISIVPSSSSPEFANAS